MAAFRNVCFLLVASYIGADGTSYILPKTSWPSQAASRQSSPPVSSMTPPLLRRTAKAQAPQNHGQMVIMADGHVGEAVLNSNDDARRQANQDQEDETHPAPVSSSLADSSGGSSVQISLRDATDTSQRDMTLNQQNSTVARTNPCGTSSACQPCESNDKALCSFKSCPETGECSSTSATFECIDICGNSDPLAAMKGTKTLSGDRCWIDAGMSEKQVLETVFCQIDRGFKCGIDHYGCKAETTAEGGGAAAANPCGDSSACQSCAGNDQQMCSFVSCPETGECTSDSATFKCIDICGASDRVKVMKGGKALDGSSCMGTMSEDEAAVMIKKDMCKGDAVGSTAKSTDDEKEIGGKRRSSEENEDVGKSLAHPLKRLSLVTIMISFLIVGIF